MQEILVQLLHMKIILQQKKQITVSSTDAKLLSMCCVLVVHYSDLWIHILHWSKPLATYL